MTSEDVPMVGIIVVNYYGGDMTLECLESLEALTWPSDRLAVALVDNGSEPGYVEVVRQRFPRTRIVETGSNLGFGGACNRGFEVLRDCEYLALLNNDAIPEPGWLEPLVAALEEDPRRGAATPKVLLTGQYLTVALTAPTSRVMGDGRHLGVQLCGARIGGSVISEDIQLVRGFWGWEHDATTIGGTFAWSVGSTGADEGLAPTALLPVRKGSDNQTVELMLASGVGPKTAYISVLGARTRVQVGVQPTWLAVKTGKQSVEVINNVGTVLGDDFAVVDRGYLEPDEGQYQESVDVWGWSGAAVLLSRRFLQTVGDFDHRFFLYYEDADLSWRGSVAGWSYRYVPESVVRHHRSATVGIRAPMALHLAARNRLIMLTKVAPLPVVTTAIRLSIADLVAAFGRDVIFRMLRLRRPVTAHVLEILRVQAGYLRLLPATTRRRRTLALLRRKAP